MPEITEHSTLEEIAAIVSDALTQAGIIATLSGGSAVTFYTNNAYSSRDLDFVTSATIADLKPVLEALGFEHTGTPILAQFEHPRVAWYLEFPASPLTFGHLHVNPSDCSVLDLPAGTLRIITPTQSVMDRLAAAYAWKDAPSRDQAILVAANQEIDWPALKKWFLEAGESNQEYNRFKVAAEDRKHRINKEKS